MINNSITNIEIDEDTQDITFYFSGSDEPWNVVEFEAGTTKHKLLSALESRIKEFNRTTFDKA